MSFAAPKKLKVCI